MAGENISEFQSSQDDLFPEPFNFVWRNSIENSLTTINPNFDELLNFIQDSNQQQMILDEAGAHEQVQSEDNLAGTSSTVNPLSTQIPIIGSNFQSSSLPACETWPGQYNFTVSFNPQNKSTKGIAWTYSAIKDKLYVGKDVPCPVNFSANTKLPDNVYIRVMAVFASPEQVTEIVTRCVNHSMDEIKNGVKEAEHLIRCESATASYHTDVAGRHSVLVPFENPAAGQQYSTYIYKFACFGSCSGGPNRRPLMLIFTLEMGQQVIGRRKLDVKICACPGRDRKSEEGQCQSEEGVPTAKPTIKKESSECGPLSEVMEFARSLCGPASKKKKVSENKKRYIEVDDDETYIFLTQVKKLHELFKFHQRRSSETASSLSESMQRVKNGKED